MKKFFILFFCFLLLSFPFLNDCEADSGVVRVVEVNGLVQIKPVGSTDWVKAEEKAQITSGDKIRSFLQSSALLVFPDKSEFKLGENSSLDIKDVSVNPRTNTAKRELKLNLGSLHYKVAPKEETAAEFKIHSSTSIVGITGTEGIMTSGGDDKDSENILIEGSTYNTDDEGKGGTYQKEGNVYHNDGEGSDMYGSDVKEDADDIAMEEEFLTLINDLVAKYEAKRNEGYDVLKVEGLISKSFEYLENREYDRVKEVVDKAIAFLEKAKKLEISADLKEKIEALLEDVKAKEEEGFDVAKIYLLLDKINQLVGDGDFDEIENIIVMANQKLESLVKDEAEDGAGEEGDGEDTGEESDLFLADYQEVQELVLDKESKGFSLDEVKATLRESFMYFKNQNLAKAFKLLEEAKKNLEKALKEFPEGLKQKVDKLESNIAAKKEAGFSTEELECTLEAIKKLIKDEVFIKAQALISELEEALVTLKKELPADWQVKINTLKEKVIYKKSLGYDITSINDLYQDLEKAAADIDLVLLEQLYAQIEDILEKLEPPAGFQADWNSFLDALKEKEVEGFDVKDLNDFKDKIQAAIDSGDINLARSLLGAAKELLDETEDNTPPNIQILTFEESPDEIFIAGFASDDTQVESVTVNNTPVSLVEGGKFSYKTVPVPELKDITVIAQDIEGNVSPPIILKVTVTAVQKDQSGEITDAIIEYLSKSLTVKGNFLPGARVDVGGNEVFADGGGHFGFNFDPKNGALPESIDVFGWNSDGTKTSAVTLTVEDQWPPYIEVGDVAFLQNVTPVLQVDPLSYNEASVDVSGSVAVTVMVNIEGTVTDIGGSVGTLSLDGKDVQFGKSGNFSTSFAFNAGQVSAILQAEDQAGNGAKETIPLDTITKAPSVTVNSKEASLDSKGAFFQEVTLTKGMTEIVVELVDGNGNYVASQKIPVASILPPALEVTDVNYSKDKVSVYGFTDGFSVVSERNNLFDAYQTQENGKFVLTADIPQGSVKAVLFAANLEAMTSEDVSVSIDPPPQDNKDPSLIVSYPSFKGDNVVFSGEAEDESGIDRVTVQGVEVTVDQDGRFLGEVELTKDLKFIEVFAVDNFGNSTKETVAVSDDDPPELEIYAWTIREGNLVISGKATDNVGLKEIRMNDMPIVKGEGNELSFSYEGTLSEDSKDAVIIAVDLFGNEVSDGPHEIEMPKDSSSPQGEGIQVRYEGADVYVSGKVSDPVGIKTVYVNGEEVDFFEDGAFNIKLPLEIGLPQIILESPSYGEGKVTVAGKIAAGDILPQKITVEAEDLSENRGVVFSQGVEPYSLDEVSVFINENVVALDETGKFSEEQILASGQKSVEVKVVDPFEVSVIEMLEFEKNAPLLELNDLEYNTEKKSILLSGKVQDVDSGLKSLLINGIRVNYDESGVFSYSASITEHSLGVVATDFVGNVTSMTKEVAPPDIWPPVFSLAVKPIPALIGSPVYVEITALDSKTTMPEMLKAAPTVNADVGGNMTALSVQGEGSSFVATLDTVGMSPSIVTLTVSGEDQAGNSSSEVEGADVFALVDKDSISPSFSLESIPSPIVLGEEALIKVFASEEVKETPSLQAILPSGEASQLELSKLNAQEFESKLTVGMEQGIGKINLSLTGGEDLSGNLHEATDASIEVVAPVQDTEIPLNVDSIELLPDKFKIKGVTASEAIVHFEAGENTADIVADVEGKFTFKTSITLEELEKMHGVSKTLRVSVKAHNYAGFESQESVFELPLPPLPEVGENSFNMVVSPHPVEQGQMVSFNVESMQELTEVPKGLIYLPDGKRAAVPLQGDKVFIGQYQLTEDVALGPAMFEVVSGTTRQSINFEIVLSSEWMQKLNKDDFFMIRVVPDPVAIGKDATFIVETLGDLEKSPVMQLSLPNGSMVDVPLSGGGRSFQGKYLFPADMPSGMAEVILNPGTPEEKRRPFGVEEEFVQGVVADAFLLANPMPLMPDAPFDVQISFSDNVPFVPQLILKLNDGRGIEIFLDGSVPSNKFGAQSKLPSDVTTGLAKFVLKDDQGMSIKSFPANVAPAMGSSKGVNVFVVPDALKRLSNASIKVDSDRPFREKIEAIVSFSDGSKLLVPLSGSDNVLNGNFQVPDYVPFGMAMIEVFSESRKSLGVTRAEVVDQIHEGASGAHVFLSNPEFNPGETVKVGVEAKWPLPFLPKAVLNWEGGSIDIPLRGNVPGNRFGGEFTAPKELVEQGIIEVKDDAGFIIGDFPIMQRAEGEGDVIVTPMPPRMGQPLSIKVIAPTAVNSPPTMRLTFADGANKDLNAYGAIPGDTFIASLDKLKKPLTLIEIVHDGEIVASIPVENLDNRPPLEFEVEPVGELVPGAMIDLIVRANTDVPFIPRLSFDFKGTVVDVPLSGMPFTRDFFGKLAIPADADLNGVNAMIYDPQGMLVWQRTYSQESDSGRTLMLNVMPAGDDGVDLNWDMLRGVDKFEVSYGETEGLGKKVEVRGNTFYHVAGLESGKTYFFQVAAFIRRKEVLASDIISSVVGQTMRELFVQDMIMGNEVHLMWQDYPGADGYRVSWGDAPGNFANSQDIMETNLAIPDLAMGGNYYIKVYAMQLGQIMGESREIFIHLAGFEMKGGDIFMQPDLPQPGTDLQIFMHFFGDLPFMPQLIARLEDGDVNLQITGEGRDYSAMLGADQFASRLMVVDVLDPDGKIILSHSPMMGGTMGGFAGPMIPIMVMPDPPPIGSDFNVRIDFPQQVPFVPKLFVELASGMKEYSFPQGPNNAQFEVDIPGADVTSSVLRLEVRDDMGMMIGEKFLGGGGSFGGPMGVMVRVNPDPPMMGQDMNVDVDFGHPIPFIPKIVVGFEGGGSQEFSFSGAPGMSVYSTVVPSGSMNSSVVRIEVMDDRGMFMGDWFPSGEAGGPRGNLMNAPFEVHPDPPVIGSPVDFKLDAPDIIDQAPKLGIKYTDGAREDVSMQGSLPGQHFNYHIDSLKSSIDSVDIIHPLTGEVKFTWMPGGPSDTVPGANVNIMVTPDPPAPFAELMVSAQFNGPVPFIPKIVLELEGGIRKDYPFPGAPGQAQYQINIPSADITANVMRIVIEDDRGMMIGDRPFAGMTQGPMVNIMVTPDPPAAYAELMVTAMFDHPAPFLPKVMIELEGGIRKEYTFPGAAGMSQYQMNIPSGDVTQNVMRVEVLDNFGMMIGDRLFGSTATGPMVNIMVNPDPPAAYAEMMVMAMFDHPVTFMPKLVVELEGGLRKEYPFPGAPGMLQYQINIPSGDITQNVMRVEVHDDRGIMMGDRIFGTMANGPMVNIMINPDPPAAYADFMVTAMFDQPVTFMPKLVVELEGGMRKDYPFPGAPGMSQYQMNVPGADVTQNVMRVVIEDDRGVMMGDRVFGAMTGPTVNIMVNPDPPAAYAEMMVTAMFDQPTPFMPKLIVELDGGIRKEYMFSGAPGMSQYQMSVPSTDLTQNVMRVVVEDDRGMMIGERMFSSTAGATNMANIMVNPDPPAAYSEMMVTAMFSQPTSFIPTLDVEVEGGMRKNYSFPGAPGMMQYQINVPSADITQNVLKIEVRDDTGMIVGDKVFGAVSGPTVNIMVNPNPPTPYAELMVTATFSQPVYFIPKVFVDLDGGIRKDYFFPGAPGMSQYQMNIPAEDITQSVILVGIEDDAGHLIGDMPFGASGSATASIMVNPDPPAAYAEMMVTAMFSQPVYFIPHVFVELDGGMRKDYAFPAAAGMSQYQINIPAADLTANIMRVGVEDDKQVMLADRMFSTAGGTTVNIMVNPDPPPPYTEMMVTAQFNQAVTFIPKVLVELEGGMMKNYQFSGAPGMSQYQINIPAADITNNVMLVRVEDDMGNSIGDKPFGSMSGPGVNITVNPDPPAPYADVLVKATFDYATTYVPQLFVEFASGNVRSYIFSQAAGSVEYQITLSAAEVTDNISRIGIHDDMGGFVDGIDFSTNNMPSLSVFVNPDPPAPYASLIVKAQFDQNVPILPQVDIGFANGNVKNYTFPGAAGQMEFEIAIPAADVTDDVSWIQVKDDHGDDIPPRKEFSVGTMTATISANPDPPTPATALTVDVTFSQNVPFIPLLFIELESGTRKDYMFSQAGMMGYNMTIPAADITTEVDRIGVEDDNGVLIHEMFFSDLGAFDITSANANGSDKIDICWDYFDWVGEYWIYYGTNSGNYDGADSPVKVSNTSCYILGDYETLSQNTTYYVKVEAYDHHDALVKTSQEKEVVLTSSSVEYPASTWTQSTGVTGEIKVLWDSVANVDGYKVYYGTAANNYTASGSPVDVTDPSATQATITGLTDGTKYYIVVEAYIGAVMSTNPQEVTAFPGGGGSLTASPTSISKSVLAGSSMTTQSISIQNNGNASATVKVAKQDLQTSGATSTISKTSLVVSPTSSVITTNTSGNFNVDLNVPAGTTSGTYYGHVTFFEDSNGNDTLDAGEASEDVNLTITVTSGGSVDHISITSVDATSAMGTPIFVTLKAHDSSHNLVSTYSTSVTMTVSESGGGQLPESWNVSPNGGPGGASTFSVGMANGKGYFTVDAQEPETLTLQTSGISSDGAVNLVFTASANTSAINSFAVGGPTKAVTGSGTSDGAFVWVSAIDSNGKVKTNYTGTANLNIVDPTSNTTTLTVKDGAGTLTGNNYTFHADDKGEAIFQLKDTAAETVSVSETGTGSNTYSVAFAGATKFLLSSGGGPFATTFSTVGGTNQSITFDIKATLSNNEEVTSYNGTATWNRASETKIDGNGGDTDSSTATPASISFTNGAGSFSLSNTEYEEVIFTLTDTGMTSGNITVDFENSDSNAPQITEVVVENPWLIHIYFSEELDATTAGNENFYDIGSGLGSGIDKVCWYGDDVTLHLANRLTLGGAVNVTVNGVKGSDNNTINETKSSISVPDVDHQGAAIGGADWFEVQPSTATPSNGTEVTVTVYHKNACGYLRGSNATNATTTAAGSGSASISYGGTVSGDSTVSMSGGTGTFKFIPSAAGQSFVITVTKDGVSGTASITVP